MDYALRMSEPNTRGRKSPLIEDEGLADAIRAKTEENEETLEEASIRMDLRPNTFWRWTRGIEPTAQFYGVLMTYLDVTLEELGALIVRDQLTRAGLPRP